MKLKRLLVLGCMAMTVAFISCSKGDQGEQGLQGEKGDLGIQGGKGDQGADGASAYETAAANGFEGTEAQWLKSLEGEDGGQGGQGQSGQDGNANVRQYDFDMSEYGGSQFIVDFFHVELGIALNKVSNYHFFLYLKKENANALFSGSGRINSTFYSQSVTGYTDQSSIADISFYKISDNTNYNIPEGYFEALRIVAIEVGTNLSGKNSKGDIMAQLKAAGVDTNDYNAVAKYFNLD